MAERAGTTARGPRGKTPSQEHGFSLEELKDWKKQIEKTVQDHPILAASIAVGAGVLIARLIRDALDEDERKRQRKHKGGLLGSELGRALMGSLATMAAAKLQEALLEGVQAEEEEEEPPRRRRPRKQGSGSAAKRARTRPRRRTPKVEE